MMMKRSVFLYTFALFSTVLAQCGATTTAGTKDQIQGLKILFNLPLPTETNELLQVPDSIFVFFYKDYVAYKLPHDYTTTYIDLDKKGDEVQRKVDVKAGYDYFGYRNNDSVGIRYDSLKVTTGKHLPVDSFIINYGVATFSLPNDYQERYTLSKTSGIADTTVQHYAIKEAKPETSCDSIYLYFSNGNDDIPFSLSKGSDLLDQKKLNKIRYLFNSRYDSRKSAMSPKREISVQMQKISIKGKHEELYEIFKRLETDKQ